jgi:hypothetical protein
VQRTSSATEVRYTQAATMMNLPQTTEDAEGGKLGSQTQEAGSSAAPSNSGAGAAAGEDATPHTGMRRVLNWLWAADRWAGERAGSRRIRFLMVAALITLTLAILGWSIYQNREALASFDWQFDPRYLGISFLCYSTALFLSVFTWHSIMGRLAGFRNWRLNIKLYLYSSVAKRLPGFVWYVGSRLYLYQQEGVPKTITSVGFVLESAMMIVSGMLVFLGSMAFSQRDWLEGRLPWLLAGMVPLLLAVAQPSLLVRLLNAILQKLGRPRLDLQVRRRDSVQWIGQYAANWVAGGLTLYCLAWAIHPLPAAAVPDVVGIVALMGVLRLIAFFIPGAWGIQEVTLSLGLTPYLPLPIALGVPLLFRLWLILSELVWVAASALLR